MLIQSAAGQTVAAWFNGGTPTQYFVVKADGSSGVGIGTLTTPFTNSFAVELDAGEVDTLGPIAIILGDAGGNALGSVFTTVLVSLPSGGAGGDVTLAAAQPNYAPAKAGDAMTLTAAYDAAKTAAQAGAAMTLTAAYDAAKTAAQAGNNMGLSAGTIAAIAAAIVIADVTLAPGEVDAIVLAIEQAIPALPPTPPTSGLPVHN